MSQIRTLGLYQPYATLMLYGKVETRWVAVGKQAPFPIGRYVIYSTKKAYDDIAVRAISSFEGWKAIMRTVQSDRTYPLKGYAIGIGNLIEVYDLYPERMENTYVAYHRPGDSRMVGLVFGKMRRIQPFPFKGKQGVGFLSKEDEAKIVYV